MPAIPASVQEEIVAVLGRGEVGPAFERLAGFADLKQKDLPALDRKTLAALGASPDRFRPFVLGLFSPHATVRRMARRYATRLGPAAGDVVVRAMAEAMQPMRRLTPGETGLVGDFGGFACPIGQVITEEELSTRIGPNAVYSEATRFQRDVMEGACAAVGDLPLLDFLRVQELALVWARPYSRMPPAPGEAASGAALTCELLQLPLLQRASK